MKPVATIEAVIDQSVNVWIVDQDAIDRFKQSHPGAGICPSCYLLAHRNLNMLTRTRAHYETKYGTVIVTRKGDDYAVSLTSK